MCAATLDILRQHPNITYEQLRDFLPNDLAQFMVGQNARCLHAMRNGNGERVVYDYENRTYSIATGR